MLNIKLSDIQKAMGAAQGKSVKDATKILKEHGFEVVEEPFVATYKIDRMRLQVEKGIVTGIRNG